LMDQEKQRWYCYADDEVFYAKENRWEEPHSVGAVRVKRAPTRQEIIRLYAVTDIFLSASCICFLALTINFNEVQVLPIAFTAVCVTLGMFGGWLDGRLRQRKLIEWPKNLGMKAFRKPRDKYIMALFLWKVLVPVGFVVAFFALRLV